MLQAAGILFIIAFICITMVNVLMYTSKNDDLIFRWLVAFEITGIAAIAFLTGAMI